MALGAQTRDVLRLDCEPGNETRGYRAGDWDRVGIRARRVCLTTQLVRSFGAQSGAACRLQRFCSRRLH